MLGVYEDFPEMSHSVAHFDCTSPPKKLQAAIVQSLHQLNRNKDAANFPELAQHGVSVELELGIADGLTFNYLDREILEHCQEEFSKQVLPTLDFLCIVRYYVAGKERRVPLKFDYYMLRFAFHEKDGELRVYHEKGTRRLATDDLIKFLVETINLELTRRKLNPLKMGFFYAL